MSQAYPIAGAQVGGIQPRLELRDLEKKPIQWSLFIQAMNKLLNMGESEPNGWWQMGSIHGLPYNPWSGDPDGPQTADPDAQWGGYCYHASALFPPWHRILVLLVEQAVVNEAIAIASGLNDAKWTKAAQELRFPFWDWTKPETATEGIPKICQQTKVQIATVDGSTVEVDNPLNHYTYASKPGAAQGVEYMGDWTRTYRWANKNVQPTEELYDGALKAFAVGATITLGTEQIELKPVTWLRGKVASLFTYDLTVKDPGYGGNMWGYFSNTAAQDDGVDPVMDTMPASVEDSHNMVHLDTGGNGSMSVNEYAGFDPIFFLHHCNVDRLYAFWEYLYPEYWIGNGWKSTETGNITSFVTDSGTFFQDSGADVNESTPLHPFRNNALEYWTSDQTRSLLSTSSTDKYYTYPAITDGSGTEVKVDVPYDVSDLTLRKQYQQILYNEFTPELRSIIQVHQKASRSLPHANPTNLLLREENNTAHLRQFSLVGRVPEFAYPGSYRLELYLLPKNRTQTEGPVVNSISVLGRADPSRCAACRDRRDSGNHLRGHMPLDPRLILHLLGRLDATQLATITTLDDLAVLIHESFGVRLVKSDGTRLATADPNAPGHHSPLDASKTPKLTLHSHVIQVNHQDPSAPIKFSQRTHHGTFGGGLKWRAL